MKPELLQMLSDEVGNADAVVLRDKLDSFKIRDFDIVGSNISLKKELINNSEEFSQGFKGISKVGRLFEIKGDEKHILIDTLRISSEYLLKHSLLSNSVIPAKNQNLDKAFHERESKLRYHAQQLKRF